MTLKEKLFCKYYAKIQNHKEAAIKTGYKPDIADKTGVNLLARKNIKTTINNIINEDKQTDLIQKSIIGLERLAFGSITDPIKLLFCESAKDIENLPEMDLFNISEIKKVKGGGFEIKFFDRIKALEKITEIAKSICNNSNTSDFFDAIKQSASMLPSNNNLENNVADTNSTSSTTMEDSNE